MLNDLITYLVKLFQPIEDIIGILDEVIIEVFFLHVIISLGNVTNKLGRQTLILRLEAILLHLLEAFLSLIVLLFQAFIIALHLHLPIEVLL